MAHLLREFIGLDYDTKVIQEMKAANAPIILNAVFQRSDAKNQNGRIYPHSVLEREVTNYQKAVHEGRAVGECVPPGTEIFTPQGWRKIEDVQAGDLAFSLNLATDEIEAQPILDTVKKEYNDELVRIYNTNTLDMTMTKGHRVWLWKFDSGELISKTAEELSEAIENNEAWVNRTHIKRGGLWKGTTPDTFTIPGSNVSIPIATWAAFLGIYIAEGWTKGTRGGKISNLVGVAQKKPTTRAQIKELLDAMPFKWAERTGGFDCSDPHLAAHMRWLGNSYEKHIPEYAKQWDPGTLDVMLSWMLIGDGRNRLNRSKQLIRELATTSMRLAVDTQEIMLKIGAGASTYTIIPQDRVICGRDILAVNSQPLHIVHMHSAKAAHLTRKFTRVERIPYKGFVYCVRMQNKTWLMRQNQRVCWTSNCDHPSESVVSLKNVSHVVREIGWRGNDVIGKLEILNTPSGQILRSLMESGIKLGISSRGVGDVQKNEHGDDVVDESFVLICFDAVSEPSTHGAWIGESRKVSLREVYNHLSKRDRVNRIVNEILR